MRVTQELWVRACRFKCGRCNDVFVVTVRHACETRGINISYSFANAQGDEVTPETQTTGAEHMRFDWFS